MNRTGVFATPEEIERLSAAASQPVMFLSGGQPMGEDVAVTCHLLALAHGLPEIPGRYGCDLKTGEFVSV